MGLWVDLLPIKNKTIKVVCKTAGYKSFNKFHYLCREVIEAPSIR